MTVLGTTDPLRDGGDGKATLPIFRCIELAGPPPLSKHEVVKLAAPFAARTVAESYLGPALLTESGMAILVLIAKEPRVLKAIREAQRIRLVFWRWNDTASAYVSFTLSLVGAGTPRPMPRWFGRSDDPLVQRVRTTKTVTFVIASPEGRISPWFVGHFGEKEVSPTDAAAKMAELFAFETPGIPCTTVGQRTRDEIPKNRCWSQELRYESDSVADFWSTLNYEGPWWDELDTTERARTVWGARSQKALGNVAHGMQLLKERRTVDQIPPPDPNSFPQNLTPAVAELLDAMLGLAPDLRRAYDAAYLAVNDPESAACLYTTAWNMAAESSDAIFRNTYASLLHVALLDSRITDAGRRRPWFRTTKSGLVLEMLPVNLQASPESLSTLWTSAGELMMLLNAAYYCTPELVPLPTQQLIDRMAVVKLEATEEETEDRIRTLLFEAHEARQWSIPWGARVAVTVGPFSSMRIYELNDEFICHFLDDSDAFFPVAVGLRTQPATFASLPFTRPGPNGVDEWNEGGQLALLLIASAIIRDFLVVEDRDSVFTSRRERLPRHSRNERTVIYLPRVRYNQPNTNPPPPDPETLARIRHSVHHHLRRVRNSSEEQRVLALQYGIRVPEGFTFVRPHQRGGLAVAERVRIYRSRSASLMLYNVVDPGPNTTAPAWFKFERDCGELLRNRRLTVIHHAANAKDGDGGMDLYCVDSKNQKYVVQCKCWAPHRLVGPEIVRALAGTMQLVDAGTDSSSRGILVTTSTFSPKAILEAKTLGIELIDGDMFVRMRRDGGFA